MNNTIFDIADLMRRELQGQLNDTEQEQLQVLLTNSPAYAQLLHDMRHGSLLHDDFHRLSHVDGKGAYERFVEKRKKMSHAAPIHRMPFLRKWRWAAAAVLLLSMGLALYYFNIHSKKSTEIIEGTALEVTPGTNRAVLTIDNGRNIDLSAHKSGIHINETVTYNDGEKISDAGQMLQVTTPRGGQYQAVLPDGTKVWLNAASSIQFPSAFNNKERKVTVTGEAYFEIAKDAKRPFKISGAGQEVEVLGTTLNISVYTDEPAAKTTLVAGSVKVNGKLLQPGQAWVNGKVIQSNTDQDIAWKNGLFNFNGADLPAVMRQLERWYDINVQYNSPQPNIIFKGKMFRDVALPDVLQMFTGMGIQCKLEGRTLILL